MGRAAWSRPPFWPVRRKHSSAMLYRVTDPPQGRHAFLWNIENTKFPLLYVSWFVKKHFIWAPPMLMGTLTSH